MANNASAGLTVDNKSTPEGLDGVIAASTRLSLVDGEAGRLIIAGYAVEDIAPKARFEELAHLLLNGRLATEPELAKFSAELAARRELPETTLLVLGEAARRSVPVIDALVMAVPTLLTSDGGDYQQSSLRLIAVLPTIVGSYWRLLKGEQPVAPRKDLSHAAHYLYQVFCTEPAPERTRALETYINTVCDHGFNASTFTARVIISTRSDMVSAITGAIGALKGPLHGGAPGPALDMVLEIGRADRAESVIRAKLAAGERLMGFGHRVYRVRDPRADVLARAAERFYQTGGDRELYQLARDVERVALRLLAEHKPGRRLDTNVEFYTALLLHGLGLANELFTPTFAVGRVLGWTAHCLEQLRDGRLIRPQSRYVGPEHPSFPAAIN